MALVQRLSSVRSSLALERDDEWLTGLDAHLAFHIRPLLIVQTNAYQTLKLYRVGIRDLSKAIFSKRLCPHTQCRETATATINPSQTCFGRGLLSQAPRLPPSPVMMAAYEAVHVAQLKAD